MVKIEMNTQAMPKAIKNFEKLGLIFYVISIIYFVFLSGSGLVSN